ncbi:MAG TPA: sugar transferase [Candidatus Hypogeohydataceae bacterium YC41]
MINFYTMISERKRIISFSLFFFDILFTAVSFFIAYWVRDSLFKVGLYSIKTYLWLLLIIIPLWSLILYSMGLYRIERTYPTRTEILRLLKAVILGNLILGAIIFGLKFIYISRLLIGFFGIINLIMLVALRFLFHYGIDLLIENEELNVLIVGTGKGAKELANEIDSNKFFRMKVLGFISENPEINASVINDYPLLGTIKDLPKIMEQKVVDEVILALPRNRLAEFDDIFRYCDEMGVKTGVLLDPFSKMGSKVSIENLKGIPVLTFSATARNELALLSKRFLDISGSALLLLTSFPLFILIFILIKFTSKGPIFFRQIRCGLNGRRFVMYKFRTMLQEAESLKKDLVKMNELNGPVFKIKRDPRVTPIGSFLRRTSLDELPQLINVLKGDMSLVGPRPPLPEEVERYKRWQRRRLSMRPGITGLWQISGRNDVDFEEWMRLDLKYIDEWSFLNDIKIIFKTVPVVTSGKGAY